MSKLRLVVLESPYAGNVDRNVWYARRAVADSLARGEAPIASHLLYTQPAILDDGRPDKRRQDMAAGHAWIPRAEALVVYTDYGITSGMEKGIKTAKKAGVPVIYRTLGGGNEF